MVKLISISLLLLFNFIFSGGKTKKCKIIDSKFMNLIESVWNKYTLNRSIRDQGILVGKSSLNRERRLT
jgi:hypothetical protein